MEYNGYKALAANVINKAISDYKNLIRLQKLKKLKGEQKESCERRIAEIERFFGSELIIDLTEFLCISFNSEKLIEKLRSEIK